MALYFLSLVIRAVFSISGDKNVIFYLPVQGRYHSMGHLFPDSERVKLFLLYGPLLKQLNFKKISMPLSPILG